MRLFFLVAVALFVVFGGRGQDVRHWVALGDQHYGRKEYSTAIDAYSRALHINPDDADLNLKLGMAYLYSDTKSKAATFIDKAYRLNPGINTKIDYHLGVAFQNTNAFKKAMEHFFLFKEKNPELASIANEKIMECQLADSLSGYELNVVIENLSFNTPDNEHSPLVSADGNTLIFTSNRNSTKKGEHEDIFIATRTAKGWSEPKLLSKNLTTEYNDAATSLSPDGTTLFIYSEEGAGDIHTSVWNGTDWSTPQPLNKNINTSQYWETSASLSADGRQLFFASNRPDGYGELDLYVSELDSKGQWGKAVNLGDLVNTPGNDDSPSIHYDGKTLYFSSDGHPRLGNSDIFVSELKGTKWQKPENMGYPINLWEYDGFFTMAPDKKTGYYATVKEGGKGMVDIYSIRFLEPKFKPKPKPVEIVATVKPESRKKEDYYDPMVQQFKDNRVVTVLRGKVIDETTAQPLAASITLVDNESKRVIARIETEEETGDFELVIPHGGNYGVTTQRSGYLFNSINFNVPKFAEYQEIDTHVIMVKAEVGSKAVLRNIFFDIGKSDLKNHSIAEIEQIVQLLEANPHMSVQINGHTDNQGNPTLNKELSLKRANAVVSYLVTKGIDAQRLSAKGYGAERPIVSNDDEAGGREINRRTEIEIIGGN